MSNEGAQWLVRLRLRVPIPPPWQEAWARSRSMANKLRLEQSKRSILKQHVKHVTAMLLYRYDAEGWWVGPELDGPRAPLPVL